MITPLKIASVNDLKREISKVAMSSIAPAKRGRAVGM